MSLQENVTGRKPLGDDGDTVVSIRAWAAMCGVSYVTARRTIAAGEGPRVTKLSARRLGIRLRHHREWLDSRSA